MKTAIIIPSLNPDQRLIDLVKELQAGGSAIVIVDDGSQPSCRTIFDLLENHYHCAVCRHPQNLGKGAALKTGIRRALKQYPELSGVVTADADGQHTAEDIARIAGALPDHPQSLILGTRDFSLQGVPFKSRWGNRITALIFYLGTGIRCPDTQTGLRGIPSPLAEFCLSVPGSRFEYEMNMLTAAAKERVPFTLMPISTVYMENNRTSAFHAVKDSARIYYHLLKFGLSSLACAAVDLTAFSLLTHTLFGRSAAGILAATVTARCFSGILNFTLNKKWCFESKGGYLSQALKYSALFCTQLLSSWALVSLLSDLPVSLTLLKGLVDSGLFILSYFIQKKYIFRKKASVSET